VIILKRYRQKGDPQEKGNCKWCGVKLRSNKGLEQRGADANGYFCSKECGFCYACNYLKTLEGADWAIDKPFDDIPLNFFIDSRWDADLGMRSLLKQMFTNADYREWFRRDENGRKLD